MIITVIIIDIQRCLKNHEKLLNIMQKILIPFSFCRECGKEFYSVYLCSDSNEEKLLEIIASGLRIEAKDMNSLKKITNSDILKDFFISGRRYPLFLTFFM